MDGCTYPKRKQKMDGCTCPKCKECCKHEPGWFMPDEIATAAGFFNLTEPEFIKKYCKEHLEDNTYAISPAQKPNSTECIFLNKKGECDIHEVKPYECRKVFGCEGITRHKKMREIIKKRWRR